MFLGADVGLLDDRVTTDHLTESSESLAVMVPVATEIERGLPLQADKETAVNLAGLESGGGYYPAFVLQAAEAGVLVFYECPLLIHPGWRANLHNVDRACVLAAMFAGRNNTEDAAIAESPVTGERGKVVAGPWSSIGPQKHPKIA